MASADPAPRKVLILGGGFGGVSAAQTLDKLRGASRDAIDVTLVSQTNYLLFYPMLAEAASGGVELTHILSPLRRQLPNVSVRVEEIQSVDLQAHTVETRDAATRETHILDWDALVIALGSSVNLAGMPGVAEHGLPFKTIGDALNIRNRAMHMVEAAAAIADHEERLPLLTFVVCGAGFSGVEMAAELYDYLIDSIGLYPSIDTSEIHVILLQGGERILPELSEGLARFAHRKLQERGVEVCLGARLKSATATHVHLTDGRVIASRSLIVAIGASPSSVIQRLEVPKERGRLLVDPTLLLQGREDVWAVGDCAAVPLMDGSGFAPPSAQFALRQGRTAGANVHAYLTGRAPERFKFRGLGQMASLGHRSAVVEIGPRLHLSGLPAWLIWRTFYLMRLPGLDRKLRVWLDWNLDLFFRRDPVQLNVERTDRMTSSFYDAGELIIREGDNADAFYVIERGEALVFQDDEGVEREIARLGAGDSFGEMALLQHQRHDVSVRALTAVDVVVLTRTDFDQLMSTWRTFAATIKEAATERESGGQ
jgi:NADH dehydrogenase